ncbi:hypothetical protein Nepgr_028330 [Nepenthes gracilis]|uniref:Uncharacterized protein n=1 Tax=Nepenthes gracilis TaxID=150966 RepID=A0AAD3Y207_NEPGR|nr:hypothetical protein Nepgr_028330 [Nepenthes gracilis]
MDLSFPHYGCLLGRTRFPMDLVGLVCLVFFSLFFASRQGLEAPGIGNPAMPQNAEWGDVGLGAYISAFAQPPLGLC